MKIPNRRAFCLLTALSLLLAFTGCAAKEGAVPAQTPAEPTEHIELELSANNNVPRELLEWAEESGWELPLDLIARQSLPAEDSMGEEYPASYHISMEDPIHELQVGNSCSAYATAFVLRFLMEEATGEAVYDAIDYKITDGLVLPQGVIDYFDEAGHPVDFYTGSLDQLKARLSSRETPIVLLIGDGAEFQHYITLVGYDEDSLYFFDSNRPGSQGSVYNWTLRTEEFLPLWKNSIPLFQSIYFVVQD